MTAKSISKPGRLTDDKWWFCEIGKHERCATEIELISRFEGCPCECHQTASTPANPSTGEWCVPNQTGVIQDHRGEAIVVAYNHDTALQVAADQAAVPRLVDALKAAMRVVSDKAAGGLVPTTAREADEIWEQCARAIYDVTTER